MDENNSPGDERRNLSLSKKRKVFKNYEPQNQKHDDPSIDATDYGKKFRKQTHWPFLFWLYLKSLGLYHSGK